MAKHFEHAEKTIEYIMAYLLSLPATVEKTTRAITDVVGANMRRDGLEPARAIGYLLKKLEVSGQVERRGQQFWKAVRTPLDNGYSRQQAELAIKTGLAKVQEAIHIATDACGVLIDALGEFNKKAPTEQQKLGLVTTPGPQADELGGCQASVKAD